MTPSRNFEEKALKIQKKPRKSLQIHKTLLPLQSPNKKARSRDRAGYLREQIRKGEKVATSPTKGDGRGKYNEIWCNGSTTDFGSVCPSSNLGISTTKARHPPGFFASNTKRLYKVKNSRNYAAIKGRNYQDINTIYKPRIIIITKAMQIT